MKYEYWKSTADNQWHWHLTAGNNEIIAYGEAYKRKADVLHVIGLVKSSGNALVENLTPHAT